MNKKQAQVILLLHTARIVQYNILQLQYCFKNYLNFTKETFTLRYFWKETHEFVFVFVSLIYHYQPYFADETIAQGWKEGCECVHHVRPHSEVLWFGQTYLWLHRVVLSFIQFCLFICIQIPIRQVFLGL